jgi:hypothetical protein
MKKVILSLVAMAMTAGMAIAQTNSVTSGNMPTASGNGYAFEFNGNATENCTISHVPQFAVTGYTTSIDEVGHALDLSTSGTQQNFIKFSFYTDNCSNVQIDWSENSYQKFTMEITTDTIIPQLLVIFYDNTGAASDLDPIIFENVPVGTSTLTQLDPAKIVLKGWAPSTPYPSLDSTKIAAVGFQIRKTYLDKTISAATSIQYIYMGDAGTLASVNAAHVNNSLISVFPNPAKDQINIDLSSMNVSNDAAVKIMNSNGMTVYEGTASGTNQVVNTSSFNKGMYLVQVSSGDKVSNKKIVIE